MKKFIIPLLILVTILAYANSTQNSFLWDDEDWVLKNSTVKDWHKWPAFFYQNTIKGARKDSNMYRPLQGITHGIDYLLYNYRTPGHHMSNIFFHSVVAILLFLMLKGIFSERIAFFSALFFAVHPVHTEAVTYISGRADMLSFLFILLAIILFEKHLIFSCLSLICALFSKESALIGPVLLILYLFFKNGEIKKDIKRLLPILCIILIYAALRLTVLDFSHLIPENEPPAFFYIPFYIRLCTFLKALPVYFGILLWPIELHMEREIALSYSMFNLESFMGVLLVIIPTVIALFLYIKKRSKIFLFATMWFFIGMFPNSNIFPVNALIYEHWLYIASLGFFLIIAWGLDSLLKKGRTFKLVSILLALSITIFCIYMTAERNKDWRDPISFYENTLKYMPDSPRLHNNLAMAYIDAGRTEDAIREYKETIFYGDYYAQPHYNLSNIYLEKGDVEAAIKELKRSIEINKDFLYSYEKLAAIYFNQGRIEEVLELVSFILEREPENKIAIEILNRISYDRP